MDFQQQQIKFRPLTCSLVFCKIVEGHQHNHKNRGDKCEEFLVNGTSVVRKWKAASFLSKRELRKAVSLRQGM